MSSCDITKGTYCYQAEWPPPEPSVLIFKAVKQPQTTFHLLPCINVRLGKTCGLLYPVDYWLWCHKGCCQVLTPSFWVQGIFKTLCFSLFSFISNVMSVTASRYSRMFWQAAANRGLNVFSGDSIDCLSVINSSALHHLWTFISKVAWVSWAVKWTNGGNGEHDTNPPSEPCVRIGAINVGVVQWEWGGCTRPLQSFNHNEISVSWQH